MSGKIVMAAMPKQFTNQLNMIKKDKEFEDTQKKNKPSVDNTSKMHSDKIVRQERERSHSDDGERWQKINEGKKIINFKKDQRDNNDSDSDGQWTKNCDVEDEREYSTHQNNNTNPHQKKKITIKRDNYGRLCFEQELIEGSKNSKLNKVIKTNNGNKTKQPPQTVQSSIRMVSKPLQGIKKQYKQEFTIKDQIQEEDDLSSDQRVQQYQSISDLDNDNNNSLDDSLDEIPKKIIPKLSDNRSSKVAYIEISNLPRQIDNSYLNDLLKKEKNHIIDSYKTSTLGRVKLDSKEAGNRAISILNKRTLYGQAIEAYAINSVDFEQGVNEQKTGSKLIKK